MAANKVWGGKGSMTLTTNNIGLGATGYTEVTINANQELLDGREFGDAERWRKSIKGEIWLSGTFRAWFETSTMVGEGFQPVELLAQMANDANVESPDVKFTIELDGNTTPAQLVFSANLSDIAIEKTSTGYNRISGTFEGVYVDANDPQGQNAA